MKKSEDFTKELNALLKKTIKNHKKIIFNGNNHTDEWVVEAEKRGLLNLKSTPKSLPYFTADKNITLFEKFKVLSAKEIHSRTEIVLEEYCKEISIEALIYKLSLLTNSLYNKTELLENKLLEVKNFASSIECADYSRSHIFTTMQEFRAVIDELETNTAKKYWPFPTYGEILFSV